MNLLDLQIKISTDMEEAIDDLDELDSKASNSGSGFSHLDAIAVATGKLVADAIEGMISKLAEFVEASISASIDFESSMAKVQTIMNPDELGVSEMSDSIMSLSSQMGISTKDIANSVYDVISATGDTANAVSLVEQATKLAKGGFAETTDAVSVLTTSINAYGLEMSDAQHIADSLITVQNLGVTTVGELSAQMGKAIATGSAYGVDLENLETGYIALTKAGIGTAEATTYMSGMINELGKSSSDVSKTLVEKTGKSFGTLMAEGNSLSDVLGILMESVDNDSEAFANLWGSAEAGKSASAIVGQGLSEFNDWLGQVQESSGATETAFETMSETTENKIAVLKTTLTNLGTEALTPMLGKISELATKLTDFLSESDFTPLVEGIETLYNAFKTIVQGVVYGFDIINESLGMTESDWLNVWSAIGNVITVVAQVIATEIKVVAMVVASLIDTTRIVTNGFKSAWEGTKNSVVKTLTTIESKFREIFDKVVSIVSKAIEKIKGFFNFEWKLPDLKLPHFSITGSFSLNPPSVPSLGVEWYAKAMDEPMLLNGATIFGSAGDTLLGGGEAGAEVIVGQDKLMSMIAEASGQANSKVLNAIYEELHIMNNGMYETITSALSGMGVNFNERELARLVRKYA